MRTRGYLWLLRRPRDAPPSFKKTSPMPLHRPYHPQTAHFPVHALNEKALPHRICPSPHSIPFSAMVHGQACSADVEVAEAIQRWDLDKLLELLQDRADVHQGGPAALKMAAQENRLEQVRDLLAMLQCSGVDINTIDQHGDTALTVAAREGHHEVVAALVDALLQSGGDLNATNKHGFTPLSEAAYKGHRNAAAVLIEALLQSGGDLNAANEYGFTPLTRAAYMGRWNVVDMLAKALQQSGSDVNISTPGCGTALTLAIDDGNLEAADGLLQAGAIPSEQDIQDLARLRGGHSQAS